MYVIKVIQYHAITLVKKIPNPEENTLSWLESAILNIINGIAFILLGFTMNQILGTILILIIVGFGYPRFLIYVNGINNQIESDDRATVLSTINMIGSLIMAIIYPFVGLIVMWNLFAVFIIIGILILILTLFTRVKSEYL